MRKLLLTMLIAVVLSPVAVFAADPTYIPLEPLPCIQANGVTCTNVPADGAVNFEKYVQYIVNLVIAIAAAASIFMIVLGGLQYMTTDSWTGKSEGLNKVKNALLGLILVLTSYLILRTIDPRLVVIPTTLVAPLNIQEAKTDLSYLDNFLNSQAQKYLDQNRAATEIVSGLKTDITNSTRKSSQLRDEIITAASVENINGGEVSVEGLCGSNGVKREDYPDIYDKCRELDKLSDRVRVESGQVNTEIFKGVTGQIVSGCIKSNDIVAKNGTTLADSCIKDIEAQRAAFLARPNQSGLSIRDINDYADYSKASIYSNLLYQQLLLIKTDGGTVSACSFVQLTKTIDTSAKLISSSTMQTQFRSENSDLITSLGGSKAKLDDGTYARSCSNNQAPVFTPVN